MMTMKKRFRFLFFAVAFLCSAAVKASRVDTIKVRSAKMDRDIPVVVVVPDLALHGQRVPTVYLLHGAGNNHFCWLDIKPELREMADRDGVMVVCPNGELSWYWDSPINPKSQFETFVAKELVRYIDRHYPVINDRKARAITGLSMGGQGSLWLAFHHKDVFGAAGSTSGGVDIRPFAGNWGMNEQLGDIKDNKVRWDAFALINQVHLVKNGELALIIDCGYQDFFYKVNLAFHEALLKQGVMHDFYVREGAHCHDYWRNSIDYQWLFFTKFFAQRK